MSRRSWQEIIYFLLFFSNDVRQSNGKYFQETGRKGQNCKQCDVLQIALNQENTVKIGTSIIVYRHAEIIYNGYGQESQGIARQNKVIST